MEEVMSNEIEINNELIETWEPKVQKIASSAFVLGMERDDIADYPAPRYNVWVGLTGDYPKRLDSFREDNK